MTDPRLISSGESADTREPLDFASLGFTGVNVFCDDRHDRQFVTTLLWHEATGHASIRGGQNHTLERGAGIRWERSKINCPACRRAVAVRAENLSRVVGRLVENGVTEVTLGGLAGIL